MKMSSLKSAEVVRRWENEPNGVAGPLAFSMARILLVAALLGAPLAFGAVVPWAWVALGLAAALALFLWALGSVQQGALKLIWSPLYIPLALFFLLGVAQYAARLTLDRSETRQALVLLVADLAYFFLAVQLFAGAGSTTLLAFGLTVLVFAGCMGLFAIVQFASGASQIYGIVDTPSGAIFGPYVNRDHFAGLMEMLIPVAVLYTAGRHGSFWVEGSVWRVSAATLALASLLLSGSRGGLLALSAEIAIATSALRTWGPRTWERRRLAMTAVITLFAGVMLLAYFDPGRVAKRLGSVVYVEGSWADWAGYRKSMILDSLHMWRDHPLLGVGLGDFETAYPRYQSFPGDLWIDHAHNDYVEAIAETGLVGAVLILSALGFFLRLAFRDWGHPFRSRAGWIRLGAAVGCCGMLVHSLWDFNLHIPANAAWFAVLAGIATTARPSPATDNQVSVADPLLEDLGGSSAGC
jgi:O-antigen ligase